MSDRSYKVPCEARVADGAIRGGMIGFLWYFSNSFGLLGEATAIVAPPHSTSASRALHSLKSFGVSVFGFGAFLGMYSGLLCASERLLPDESSRIAAPTIAGVTIGTAIGACLPPPRVNNMIMCAAATGGVSALCSYVMTKQQSKRY